MFLKYISDCRQPRTIDNGNIQVIGKTTYLSKATVSCDIGYDLTPVSASIMCKADGEWEDASCTIKGVVLYEFKISPIMEENIKK
jgi:hypothetical protein